MAPADADPTPPSPEAAFAALAEETRLAVLRVLGGADGPLAFSDLRQRVGYETSGNFSYHLDELEGHFIDRSEAGYRLRRPGERVVEALLAGAVTDTPEIERTRTDRSCPFCGAPVELRYRSERLVGYCTECAGVYGARTTEDSTEETGPTGLLGHLPLPPAGVRNRSIDEIERAAWTWGYRDMVAISRGVCPRCSAHLEQSAQVCRAHDAEGVLCSTCRNRHAVQLRSRCRNCIYEQESAFVVKLATEPTVLSFLTDRGLDPVLDHWDFGWEYDEEISSRDPFQAQFTFELDGDELEVTVDDALAVTTATVR